MTAREAEMAARWAHIADAMAAASGVPDYVPTEWSNDA